MERRGRRDRPQWSVPRSVGADGQFEEVLASELPAVLDLRVDPEANLPSATLTEIRRTAQAD